MASDGHLDPDQVVDEASFLAFVRSLAAHRRSEPNQWQNFVGEEDETGLHFIPASRARSPWRNVASAPGFKELIMRLRQHYDLIVLDCPPILVGADGATTASMADKSILVTAWDRTPIPAVRRAMAALQRRPRAQTAVYVNRVPPEYRFGRLRGD